MTVATINAWNRILVNKTKNREQTEIVLFAIYAERETHKNVLFTIFFGNLLNFHKLVKSNRENLHGSTGSFHSPYETLSSFFLVVYKIFRRLRPVMRLTDRKVN